MINTIRKVTSFILTCIALLTGCTDKPIDNETLLKVYGPSVPAPAGPLKVFHLGHSLVGEDIPVMIQQLAGSGHEYSRQVGWGTQLQAHWESRSELPGFEVDSSFTEIKDAIDALDTEHYDVLVATESVEIRDAIKYHDSSKYLTKFANHARSNNPNIRLYLYETWHETDDKEGWLFRVERDYSEYWQKAILDQSLLQLKGEVPIFVIPVGQVMASILRKIESNGGPMDLSTHEDFFKDKIHLNDIGAYLAALVHYSAIYQKSPVGLPYELLKHDGQPAQPPSRELAELMQVTTWEVLINDFRTGLSSYISTN